MKKICLLLTAAAMLSSAAVAQSMSAGRAELMSSVPTSAKTVSDWYKQDIYDPSDSKIGKIDDVLVSGGGQINAVWLASAASSGLAKKMLLYRSARSSRLRKTTRHI